MKFLPFEDAREYVHNLGLKSSQQWNIYCNSGTKPQNIPRAAWRVYNKEWKGWGDWLGTGRTRNFRSYEDARDFVHELGLKSSKDWRKFCNSGKKPPDIPTSPDRTYNSEWISWGDWLGTENLSSRNRKYRSYEAARRYVHTLGLTTVDEWKVFSKSGKRPLDIPAKPYIVYKKKWKKWIDWLGSPLKGRRFKSFDDAKNFVNNLGLKSLREWRNYCNSTNKPDDIPSNPPQVYTDWSSWGDWLGTDRIADQYKHYRPFESARSFVRSLGLKSASRWKKYCGSDQKPPDIPAKPYRTYKNKGWISFGDWLGTNTVAYGLKKYRSYEEARDFAHGLDLTGYPDWQKYSTSENMPQDIPRSPENFYPQWKGWPDFLGYEEKIWSVRKVKELLRSMIDDKIIYRWADDELVLWRILHVNGLLNLEGNRHVEFFKNFTGAVQTKEGLKAIEDYANSNSEVPPDLSIFSNVEPEQKAINEVEGEIQIASTQEIASLINQQKTEDPLEYNNIKTPEEILESTNAIQSITVDEETMQFLVSRSINKLWKKVFPRSEEENNRFISTIKKNGNKYHDTVIDIFLKDYKGAQEIKNNLPSGYSFEREPKLMQLYVAHKINTSNYFGNFSGTGAGKTLSAVLASRVIESKMTVVVCPNDVVEQWKNEIEKIFHDSIVITGKQAFYTKCDYNKYQYLVLNYDKFSQEYSTNLILTLAKEKIDFIILDEIHYVKKRGSEDQEPSQRHRNLEGMMTAIRNRSKDNDNEIVKVLGLSATPVINDLVEGKSLLEIITGKRYDDVSTNKTVPNAIMLYEKLSTISIREMPEYKIYRNEEHVEVIAKIPKDVDIKELRRNPSSLEQFLTDARIPEIINRIKGKTIIYTEYVTGIIPKLREAVANAGYTFTEYTGSFRDLKSFTDEHVQVLLASKPISTGLDGIQRVCNNLIINTLPWTNAQYQQLIGRLVRPGQDKNFVNVHIIEANLNGLFPYDRFIKWNRIEYKRTLADCAVDGVMPLKNLATPHQAHIEAIKWYERLMRNEISTVIRRDLNVVITPVETERRILRYGDFTKLNNKINNENSETTHKRMSGDPKEWDMYHRQYREARKSWPIVPFDEIIKRLSQMSPRHLIGDFGCGEAKILEKFGAGRVFSFDHVAINNKVTACDIKSVPLSEKIDIAVFSLSLMGKNWPDYIKEAKRCLHTNGFLFIAETAKSMKGRLSKLREVIKQYGFQIYKDEERGDFTFIEAREL